MGIVPAYPPNITASGTTQQIRSAFPVRGYGQWRDMADLANWLAGRGGQLVAGNPTGVIANTEGLALVDGIIAAGSSKDHYVYFWPRTTHTRRVWLIALGSGFTGRAFGTFENGSATTLGEWEINPTDPSMLTAATYIIEEDWTPAVGGDFLRVLNDAGSESFGIFVMGFCCFEMPLVSTSIAGNEQTLNSKSPIYAASDDSAALDMVSTMAVALESTARRPCLFSYSGYVATTITATTFTGTSNVFVVNPTVMPRHLYDGQSTGDVNWAARVKATGGNGHIRLSMTSGDTDNVTITSTTFHWVTGTISVREEDPSRWDDDGGIRTGSRDFVTVELATSGTNVQFQAFYMGEG